MELPSIDNIAARSKRKKRDLDAVLHAFETLVCSADDDTILGQVGKLPREARDCWLVAKYGVERVVQAQRVLQAVPDTLTSAQRREVIEEWGGEDMKEIIAIMQSEGFRHLLCTCCIEDKTCPHACTLVLTPPTNCCYECGKKLVSNHKTKVSVSTSDL